MYISLYIGETLTEDKFFYHHDVGSESVCRVGIARIPYNMYQKLELGKIVASTFGSSKPLEVVMIDSSRDIIVLDSQMCKAIVGGMQMNSFTMPSLKMKDQSTASSTVQKTIDDKNTNLKEAPTIQFVSAPPVQQSLVTKAAGEVIEDEIKKQDDKKNDESDSLTGGLALLKMQAELQMKLEAEQGTGEDISGKYSGREEMEDDFDEVPALGSKFKQFIDDPTDMEAAERRKKKVSDLTAIMEANMAKSSEERWDATEGFQNRKSLSLTRDNDEDVINDGGFEKGVLSSNNVDKTRKEIQREIIINQGTNIARALAALPPNVLHPTSYADVIKVGYFAPLAYLSIFSQVVSVIF